MKNKVKEKIMTYIIIFILVFVNSIFFIQPTVNATVEEGKFTVEELPYNIKINKIAVAVEGYDTKCPIALDEDGALWEWNGTPSKIELSVLNGRKIIDIAAGYRWSLLYNR